jgi:dTDP-4-dehydrorhamnose 3,5-epimerase
LEGVVEIVPKKFGDGRGFFSETYSQAALAKEGINVSFVQDNHSLSAKPGVLRGLHYQIPPFAQAKLVRVTRGRIFDVTVDIRPLSPNFSNWAGVEISADKWNQIFVPEGFAHGFVTLEPDTEVVYKVSAAYSPEHERTIRFDDPDIAIQWPMENSEMILSDKDRNARSLKHFATGF